MTKPPYERPLLVRHELGMMNKFARVQSMRPMSAIDGVSVDTLVEQYGSPLFVFSEKTLLARYRELKDAFTTRWPKVRIAWSYKTNYLDAICRIFHNEGAWAEVVSAFEHEKAVHLGIPPHHIHFNGPYKPKDILERALLSGTLVHIDHFDEVTLAEQIASAQGIRPKVAIRINLRAEGLPHWGRFGFNLESGQALDAVIRIISGDALELAGLHCHLGTFISGTEAYEEQAEKLTQFANQIREQHGITLEFIDIGGGFASHNTLKSQYLPGDQTTPSFSRYAEALCDQLSELDYPADRLPTLVLETGRALVDDAGFLISTVHATKRLPDGRAALVIDSGVNNLFTAFWFNHDVVPAQPFSGIPEPTVIYGPLCMNIDVVRDSLLFPPLLVGDRLIFKNVGAYNVTQWMQFITYRPAVVLVGQGGRHGLLRRREDLDSVISGEEMPTWL